MIQRPKRQRSTFEYIYISFSLAVFSPTSILILITSSIFTVSLSQERQKTVPVAHMFVSLELGIPDSTIYISPARDVKDISTQSALS